MRKIERKALFPRILAVLMVSAMLLGSLTFQAAASDSVDVPGKVYTFGKDSDYPFSGDTNYAASGSNNTYGNFSVKGNIAATSTKNGVPAYEVSEGALSLFYNYTDTLLNADLDSWHLIEDSKKNVDSISLNGKLLKGAIILQTSKDRLNWLTLETLTDAFDQTPTRTEALYSTKDVELINGCFYRVIVAYSLRIRTEESSFLGFDTSKYDYKKHVEVYEFYAYTDSGDSNAPDPDHTHSLGTKVRVDDFDAYFGTETIDKDDAHYGWDLGNFFISGYTDKLANSDGDMVFLKNVGDKVTLWFNLEQNIDALNGADNLKITADTDGYDQYFETPKMNFGRGLLIIRYTDHNNNKSEPTYYTNYLEANASVGADTKVQLFEEGDYEIALDYEITTDKFIDNVGHYRIFFKFSVRNGNCMVYPFDVATGSELTNSSMTDNGFRLDLAKSRYLKVNVKREVLTDSADGLVEDTRFNGPAKDGAEYTDEGIYTITVQNEYTGQFTVKKIYVGTNNILRAHMTTGLSIPEINNLVAQGATIADDGTITLSNTPPATEPSEPANTEPTVPSTPGEEPAKLNPLMIIIPVCVVLAGAVVAIFVFIKRTRKPSKQEEGANEA